MINLQHISKTFGTVTALDDVSFDLPEGHALALIGPTAAGKSVLLKILAGLYPADNGDLHIAGHKAGIAYRRPPALARRIGMLFQHNALFDSLTVWENIGFRLMRDGLSRKKTYAQVAELLPQVGLSADTAVLFPSDLSGGMRKRVGFARAIATRPDILLLDNPIAGLDPILAARIDRMIGRMTRERGTTVISVTGDMNRLYDAYDKVAVLVAGRLRWFGTSADARAADNPYLRQLISGSRDGPIEVLAR